MQREALLENHDTLRRQKFVRADDRFDFFPAKNMQHPFLEDNVFPEIQSCIQLHFEGLVENLIRVRVPMRVLRSIRFEFFQLLQCTKRVETFIIEIENIDILRCLKQEHAMLHLHAELHRINVHVQLAKFLEYLLF